MVRTNTVHTSGDAAIIRLKGTNKALAVKTDGNARYVYLNPNRGAQIAVAESARNVVVSGARPLAITNCLNFGNPYDPEIFWQFKEAVAGISSACRAFNTPVTGGNVSFYNEGPSGPIFPTPVIGMLGFIESLDYIMTPHFKSEGDVIILIGETRGHLGGSEYMKACHNLVAGDAPEIDLAKEKRTHDLCLELIHQGLVSSVHDVSEGGLAVAIIECCISDNHRDLSLGARIELDLKSRPDSILFGEDQSRIVISTPPNKVQTILRRCTGANLHAEVIGEVQQETIQINELINLRTSVIADAYFNSLEKSLK